MGLAINTFCPITQIFVDGYDNNPGLLVDDCTLIGYSLDRKNNRTGRYTIL